MNDHLLQEGQSTLGRNEASSSFVCNFFPGFLNPLLYQNPTALHDITDGCNEGCQVRNATDCLENKTISVCVPKGNRLLFSEGMGPSHRLRITKLPHSFRNSQEKLQLDIHYFCQVALLSFSLAVVDVCTALFFAEGALSSAFVFFFDFLLGCTIFLDSDVSDGGQKPS